MAIYKPRNVIPTIDVNLVTISTPTTSPDEIGFDTSNQVTVEPVLDTTDAVTLTVKGIVRAKKPEVQTVTGDTITLTDNVFNPELVVILQGGTIVYDTTDPNKIISYTPPLAGSGDTGEVFTLKMYTAQYSPAGLIVNYECVEYPNCQGQPISLSAEDGSFFAPSYTIVSSPDEGEAPYTITYVDTLPTVIPRP